MKYILQGAESLKQAKNMKGMQEAYISINDAIIPFFKSWPNQLKHNKIIFLEAGNIYFFTTYILFSRFIPILYSHTFSFILWYSLILSDFLRCSSVIKLKDKLQLLKTVKLIQSSTFVSIVISICILVNLFAPGFSTVIMDKSVALQPESHTCKCNPEPHSISSCCCATKINTSEGKSLLKEDYQGIFSTFIKSLGCAGLPDQSTSLPYNVSLPEDGISSTKLSMLYYLKKHEEIFPASIKISPPDKPPRHLA